MLNLKTIKLLNGLNHHNAVNTRAANYCQTKFFAVNRRTVAAVLVAPFLIAVLWMLSTQALAQAIFKCPTANGITPYTNDKVEASRLGCTPLVGGNVTVVEGTKVQNNSTGSSPAPVRVATAPQAGSRIDAPEQRARDSDSRAILEAELKKAEAKQNELLKEYNNGEPEKQGSEARNNQKYLDRVAELKSTIARNDSDIAGIKREITRLPK